MRADLRLAWALLAGSDRREWWRITLTAVGAVAATGFALAAVTLASLDGQYSIGVAHGLLDQPGERAGVVLALVLLLIPVTGFLGQCARIGAAHRDRRLAGLRLAGASPWQVRRIAAYETGLTCLVGSAVATVFSVLMLLTRWGRPPALAWAGIAAVAVAVPVVGVLVSVLALRRVVASPLGRVRRVRAPRGRASGFVVAGSVVAVAALLGLAPLRFADGSVGALPLAVCAAVLLVGAGAVALSGASALLTGRLLAARTDRPAVLIAAERLRDDPWTAARTHAAVLLVTVVATGFVGVRQVFLAEVRTDVHLADSRAFYTTGVDLAGAAVAVGLLITLCALAVGTAESVAARRRGLAAQRAAGVPRSVLARALLLETALPLAPALALAGTGGMAIGVSYAAVASGGTWSFPWPALLVPAAIYTAALLSAATSLPLLGRSTGVGELRYT
ncbi:FtsX-like permease family protein [Streptomyces sp. NPDC088387]|uniref:FtsX-like permease family protein n=1 Tax=Streptomyces sp. NPDC088387 TaxID=3365859 RepID=UPI0037FBDAFA